jgi:hypothetical protein
MVMVVKVRMWSLRISGLSATSYFTVMVREVALLIASQSVSSRRTEHKARRLVVVAALFGSKSAHT